VRELVADPHEHAELVHLGVGESGGRFVEAQPRVRGERAISMRLSVPYESDCGPVAYSLSDSRSRIAERGRRRVRAEPPGMRAHHDVLRDGERGEQREVLERTRDSELGDAVRGHGEQVLAREGDAPRGRLVEAAETVEQRRLARTVGADEGADLSLLDLERQVCEREDPAELDSHVLDSQQSHDAV
jgi:hypothetical protein